MRLLYSFVIWSLNIVIVKLDANPGRCYGAMHYTFLRRSLEVLEFSQTVCLFAAKAGRYRIPMPVLSSGLLKSLTANIVKRKDYS